MSSKDLQVKIKTQKALINELLDRLENHESMQRIKCADCIENAIQDYADLVVKTEPLNDPYFKNLTYEQIAELAKKSIRLTAENCTLRHKLEDISELLDSSELGKKIRKIIERKI